MRAMITWLAVLGALLTVWGMLPDLHRSSTSIALLRPATGLLCLLGVLVGSRRFRLTFGAIGLAALGTVIAPLLPGATDGELRVYSKNLFHNNTEIEPIVSDILAANVDLVMLQELVDENAHILARLEATFPHQHVCRYSGRIRIAVLSRHPMTAKRLCSGNRSTAGAQVKVNDQQVWAISVHVPHPWPTDTAQTEAEVLRLLAALEPPVVVAGDFNAFPWTPRVLEIARASGTKLAGPARRTYTHLGLPFPIDHALAPGGGSTQLRPKLGSNHWGLVANLSLTE